MGEITLSLFSIGGATAIGNFVNKSQLNRRSYPCLVQMMIFEKICLIVREKTLVEDSLRLISFLSLTEISGLIFVKILAR